MNDLIVILVVFLVGAIFYKLMSINIDDSVVRIQSGYQPSKKPQSDILYPPKGGSNVGYPTKRNDDEDC